jgi:hypothetical protein
MKQYRKIQFSISWIAFLAIVIHLFFPCIKIDAITLILIWILILPWLIGLFKSVEVHGVKFEFQDLEPLAKVAKKLWIWEKTTKIKKWSPDLKAIYDSDPILAFASIRIELEKSLKKLWQWNKNIRSNNLRALILDLYKVGLLSKEEEKLFNDIIPILNLAIHGEKFDMEASKWLINNAPWIIESLDKKFKINEV